LSRIPLVRPAKPSDIDALIEIEAVFPTDRLDRRSFRRALRSPTIDVLVIESDAIAGYAMVHRRGGAKVVRLTSLAVRPDSARCGLGRRLLAAMEERALRLGCERLRLEVRADNPRARRLYEAAGYRRFDIAEDYYEDGETAWRYEKALV
jgi:[ribosomal protein S18]-alanine N-acetyltransferase